MNEAYRTRDEVPAENAALHAENAAQAALIATL
jgi:hypothetical protein